MLLDSTVLVRMFTDGETAGEAERRLGEEDAFVSVVQLAEVAGWAIREGKSVRERIEWVKDLASLLPLDEGECREAAAIRDGRRKAGVKHFGIIDGIVLATARAHGQRVLTTDRHFEGEEDCVVLR